MKFLVDQNLPPLLAQVLNGRFPGSSHVIPLRMDRSRDLQLWRYAKEQGYALLTRDDDFHQLSMLHGAPPKVVFLANAEGDAADLARFVAEQLDTIARFMEDPESSLLLIRRP